MTASRSVFVFLCDVIGRHGLVLIAIYMFCSATYKLIGVTSVADVPVNVWSSMATGTFMLIGAIYTTAVQIEQRSRK